ncbi:hypothetical protein D3Z63_07175 [Vibrio parahaemolyticus]|uniref:Uncharacterized protein n=1 Tax=Vibrio parahaemolyticus TaxID=670 RepID=A0A249VXY2_VIBPH|nr:hypothetical protein YA91_00920 [Vibrio parahaemolyticus]KIS83676.1 hypothetical protein H321_15510 [Vibrio parahaemolyticus 97-10290]KIS87804.1 hypothetical protein H338_15485 [Vibrio parahaemolyticus EN9701173]KIS90651.1 hypothetical protein H333_15515 [Vibrio parahaemolyticus 12315]KIS96322.1 hypothetical protein H324_15475 [Vibrio parahaemolyticus 846]KIT00153.1 hypothetical protein H327_15550 [Vibrio parahaemolyticus 3324]KIT04991.1 hypothetical protein H339_15535 [Vibrio parahaemolyt
MTYTDIYSKISSDTRNSPPKRLSDLASVGVFSKTEQIALQKVDLATRIVM